MQKERITLEKIKYTDIKDIKGVKKIYTEAFPKNERKPFSMILSHNKAGTGSLVKIMLDGQICGFFFTLFYENFALVDYFAIHKDFRNRGLGEIALALLSEEYYEKQIFLEIEDPESNETAARRLGFYRRCGFIQTGVKVNLFTVDMELLTFGEFYIDFATYFALYTSIVGEKMAKHFVKERKK